MGLTKRSHGLYGTIVNSVTRRHVYVYIVQILEMSVL